MRAFLGKNFMRSWLANLIIITGIAYIFYVSYHYPEKIDTCMGYFFGLISGVSAFYYNTNQGSQEKNEMLRDSTPVNPATTSSIKMEVQGPETSEDKKT